MKTDNGAFTMVELIVATGILLIAAIGLIGALLSAVYLTEDTRETALASEAARMKVEELKETNFDSIFSTYIANPHFDVAGLDPQDGDADGRVGRILFPVTGNVSPQLSEAVSDASLGMPRDLNGNGSAADTMTNGYVLLPVRVKIRWKGRTGNKSYELLTLLAE